MHRLKYTIILIWWAVCGTSGAADWYVATNGSDAAAGSIGAPFATISNAVVNMSAGETCLVRGGTYHEAVVVSGQSNLTFKAYPGETVTMDGTVPISSAWIPHTGNICKTTLSDDVWQLFADGEMMMPARWPNAFLHDGSVWDLDNHWARINHNINTTTTMVDNPTVHSDLSALPFSVADAMAVLNVGSFKTYTRQVNTHAVGSDTFTVDAVGSLKSTLQFYFLEGKLEFLDAEREWFYNPATRDLYFWGDTNSVIRGKVQDYAFHVTNSDDITISGINFFGTTVYFTDCDRTLVEKGAFDYPSCTKRMLGVHSTAPFATAFDGGSGTTFFDNTMRYAETQAIYMNNGTDNTIENCLFEYIDWSCGDLPTLQGTVYMRGTGSTFRGNTAHTTGASEFLDVNAAPLIELNRISNIGLVQNDGAMIQLTINAQPNSETAYNWFMDSDKYGARFDASTALGSPTGTNGLMHHNVGFNIKAAIMQKGDYHRCINNTALDNENNGIIILSDAVSTNVGTVVRNNAAEKLGSSRSGNDALTGVMEHSHNWNGYENADADLRTLLRDPDNLDFRPQADSVLVDGGVVQDNLTDGYIGSAPDIGAYEHGASNYWIPGRRKTSASTPIPPDGSTTAKATASLMWLPGLESISSDVYLGTSLRAVATATTNSGEYVGNQSNNIHDPLGLYAQTYYWRVDEVSATGIVKGTVWSFTPEGGTPPPEMKTAVSRLPVNEDSWIQLVGDNVSSNYGAGTYLRMRGTTRYSYLKFDLSDLDGAQVVSAKLNLKSLKNIDNVSLHGVADNSWLEMDINGSNNPSFTAAFASKNNITSNVWMEIDASSYIDGTGIWSIALSTTQNAAGLDWHSRESAGNAPYVELTYASPDADLNTNSIPDWWETEYFGNTVANTDFDFDGMDNLGEYLADTNPTNPLSIFMMDGAPTNTSGFVVSFTTSTNRKYTIKSTTNLVSNVWSPVTNNIPGTGNIIEITVPISDDQESFKIEASVP